MSLTLVEPRFFPRLDAPPSSRVSLTEEREGTLLKCFNALWHNHRYTRHTRPKETPTRRESCAHFYQRANDILGIIRDADLPSGVTRNPEGKINGFDIVQRVDEFRVLLARVDG